MAITAEESLLQFFAGVFEFLALRGELFEVFAAALGEDDVARGVQSLPLMVRAPSLLLCLSSWQRKQPGQSLCPMLFG
ncbi:MAG: hypothetical protein U1G07_05460 [Verrucomicrobiota bacterium]